jgi:hypothetical protein
VLSIYQYNFFVEIIILNRVNLIEKFFQILFPLISPFQFLFQSILHFQFLFQNFFDVDLNTVDKTVNTDSTKSLVEIIKFVALFTILFYICIHPASIGRFTDNPIYKQLLQTATFATILFLYLYFNK